MKKSRKKIRIVLSLALTVSVLSLACVFYMAYKGGFFQPEKQTEVFSELEITDQTKEQSKVQTDAELKKAKSEADLKMQQKEERVLAAVEQAQTLISGCFFDEALAKLSELSEEDRKDMRVIEAEDACQKGKENLKPYEGQVGHIFFHSLIVDTARSFDGDKMTQGYNSWMTTITEFQKILEYLYERNYILIDIHQLAEQTVDENGNTVYKKAMPLVPEGKIPLVLSVDDVSYYDYMENDGFAKNLFISEDGTIKNHYINEYGQELVGEYDVVPILDSFVREHPDFSYRGAKGIIAATGYEGTLGYRVNETDAPDYAERAQTVKDVAARLKETGWQFASHGYGHRHSKDISVQELSNDTKKWREVIGNLVGETDIYIYPYGEEVDYPSDAYNALYAEGFRYFCGVWSEKYTDVKEAYVRQSRVNLDGFMMKYHPDKLEEYFPVAEVMDPLRPAFEE